MFFEILLRVNNMEDVNTDRILITLNVGNKIEFQVRDITGRGYETFKTIPISNEGEALIRTAILKELHSNKTNDRLQKINDLKRELYRLEKESSLYER